MPLPPYPSVPNPVTWVLNEEISTSQLRNDVTNAVNFLANRPLFYGQNSTGQNWNSGTDLGLAMTADLVDNWSGHNTVNGAGAYSSQYFCQAPGWYLARSSIPFTYTGSTQYVFAGGFSGQTAGAAFTTVRGALTLGGSTPDPLAPRCDRSEE